MTPILGVFFHAVGGFAAGSFYIPYKKVKRWPWEIFWLVGGFVAWLIVPVLICWLTIQGYISVLNQVDSDLFFWPYIFGLLWGIGGLTFGLTMRYLGMSLGMALVMGLTAAFGTLIPPLFDGSLQVIVNTTSGQITLVGILLGLIGTAIVGKAGLMKDRELSEDEKSQSIQEFDIKKGIIVAFVSGVLSACFAFGVASGQQVLSLTSTHIIFPLFSNSLLFSIIMLGGLTSNLVWCVLQIVLNGSFHTVSDARPKTNYRNLLLCMLGGTTWYAQFFFYGMGSTLLKKFDFASWSLHMTFIIIFSTLWGILLKEWELVNKNVKLTMMLGLVILLVSTIVIGLGNSFSTH